MNFGELLSTLRDGILHDSSDQAVGAVNSDYLWTDQVLTTYINEAQRRFAVGSLCIRDAVTPEVTQIQMVQWQRNYAMHSSVIAVLSAHAEGDRADLARAGHSAFDTYRMPDAYFFNPSSLSQLPPGKVVAYDTDEGLLANNTGSIQVINLRLYPAPKAPHLQLVKLRVIRKPLYHFTVANLTQVPEIPDDHHMDMLDWAAYLALRKVDRDAEDVQRAEMFKTQFEVNVKRARDIAMRKLFTPSQWGFGRNGFSYQRDGEGS